MRIRSTLPAAVAGLALLAPAGATAQEIQPAKHAKLAKVLRKGDRSPVRFPRATENAAGPTVAFRKGRRLRRGQVIQVGVMRGPLVFHPRDCPCQGFALRGMRGKRLANVVVKAVRRGRVIATSLARQTLIEGDGVRDLGYAYDWGRVRRDFPNGTRLVVYGLFLPD